MRKSLALAFLVLVVLGGLTYSGFKGWIVFGGREEKTVLPYQIYENALGYTVFITNDSQSAFGSGFVIEEDGKYFVITAAHVVSQENEAYYAHFAAEKIYRRLKKIGWDKAFDVAVLEFEDGNFKPSASALQGDSRAVKAGDDFYILGSPVGVKFLLSEGRLMKSGVYAPSGLSNSLLPTAFLAIDATCNPGNSGGPVINRSGEAVGIAEGIIAPRSICLATPIHILKSLWPTLKAGGEIKHGSVGLGLVDSWDLTPAQNEKLGLKEVKTAGVIVADVASNSPAGEAGLRKGDVLLSYGHSMEKTDTPITDARKYLEEFHLYFFLGDEIALRFSRGEDYLVRKLKVVEPSSFEKQSPPSEEMPQTKMPSAP